MDYRNYLEHYGVLGMHWGIRKDKLGARRDRIVNKQKNWAKTDKEDWKPYLEKGLQDKRGRTVFTAAEVQAMNKDQQAAYRKTIARVEDKYNNKIQKLDAKEAERKFRTDPSEEHLRKVRLQKKSILAMSNLELRQLNERMQLEQTYRNLSPKKVTLGKSWNDSFMKKQATTTRNQFASQASAALIKKALLGVI